MFQTEAYAILLCLHKNNLRAYRKRRIDILINIQAAVESLRSPKIKSRLILECLNELATLADNHGVTLMWVSVLGISTEMEDKIFWETAI